MWISNELHDRLLAHAQATEVPIAIHVREAIALYLDRAAGAQTPSRERLRVLTRDMRQRVTSIDDAIAEADDLLGEIETAAGLVTETGARVDE